MTINEVTRQADANNKIKKAAMQERALNTYKLPQLIGNVIGNMFSKQKVKYPELYDLWPDLFEKEAVESSRQKSEQLKAEAGFLALAKAMNKRRKEE